MQYQVLTVLYELTVITVLAPLNANLKLLSAKADDTEELNCYQKWKLLFLLL